MRWQPLPENRKQVIFISPSRLWAPHKQAGTILLLLWWWFFSLYPWWPAYCMIQNMSVLLINGCWMNNPNYNGEVEDSTPSWILSSYLTLFLNVDKADRWSTRNFESWDSSMDSHRANRVGLGPRPWNFPEVKILQEASSFQRVEFLAFSPNCLLTTH